MNSRDIHDRLRATLMLGFDVIVRELHLTLATALFEVTIETGIRSMLVTKYTLLQGRFKITSMCATADKIS